MTTTFLNPRDVPTPRSARRRGVRKGPLTVERSKNWARSFLAPTRRFQGALISLRPIASHQAASERR